MIIVNLIGGLGNQMFQYACGYALGHDTGLPVKVTTDMLDRYSRHNGPQLERVFQTSIAVANEQDLRQLLGRWRTRPNTRMWLGRDGHGLLRGHRFVVEDPFHHQANLPELARHGLYLQGYWQSERYFKQHTKAIRKEFTFRHPPTGRNAELAQQLRQDVSVSLHIRRGDYAHCPKTRAFHGLCEPDYYASAIEFIRQRIPVFQLFAFSDDPQWVADTLQTHYSNMVIVNHNQGDQSHNDMLLMSMCDHHIIANSSFSWWGAWLNPSPDKIVIAPRKWFANTPDTADLIPANWVRL